MICQILIPSLALLSWEETFLFSLIDKDKENATEFFNLKQIKVSQQQKIINNYAMSFKYDSIKYLCSQLQQNYFMCQAAKLSNQ